MTPTFLTLPPEVRVIIYGYLLVNFNTRLNPYLPYAPFETRLHKTYYRGGKEIRTVTIDEQRSP
ncbi:uncharacterized protein KY384_007521 [Bacidia gigantensis]|uniref:uncharacterized protein n=1 Tax=Bacidia gigantensis TaxID=2732470 RepID=UPI001D0455A7|nr:uncharacterized protein KY384_007521 [Bacidia gigantensis]KAG8527369.1 hypothetical protein KY384_007521 [Bacidia gigantensis]